jgi:L-malate glycosyltransferase
VLSFFARLSRLKKVVGFYAKITQAEIIFFFPFYHLGGAEKVHAQICHCFKDKKCTIIFTRLSINDGFKSRFPQEFKIIDLNDFDLDKYNLLIASILRFFINLNPRLILFGANSVFFYNLIPYLKPSLQKIDLIHASEGGIAEYSLSRVHLLHQRVIISSHIRDYLADLYQSAQIDPQLLAQIVHIPNFVSVPTSFNPLIANQLALKIIFVGRNAPEKRIHLIKTIAQQCYLEKLAVEFSLVGDFEDPEAAPNLRFIAPIYEEDKLYALYQSHSIFMLTSRNEGLPLSLMEAMANGLIPICTQVGGIEHIIQNQENGFLLKQPEDEAGVVAQALQCLKILSDDPDLRAKLAQNAYNYAQKNFSFENFYRAYRQIILADL